MSHFYQLYLPQMILKTSSVLLFQNWRLYNRSAQCFIYSILRNVAGLDIRCQDWCYVCVQPESPGWHALFAIKSHYNDVIMGAIASQITGLASVYSAVKLGADQRKHQSSASLAFVRGIHRRPVNSPRKGPVTRKKFPFDDVIMFAFPIKTRMSIFKIITTPSI